MPPLRATLSSGAVIEYADRHFGKVHSDAVNSL